MKIKEESGKAGLKLSIQKTKIMASSPTSSWQIDGETMEIVSLFSWAPKSVQKVTATMKLKDASSLEEKLYKPTQHVKKQRHYFANKCLSSQSFAFSISHVCMWQLDHKESWVPKNWCFFLLWCWRRLWRVLWTTKRSNQSFLKEISSKYSLERWCWSWNSNIQPPDAKNWPIGKEPWYWERLKAGGERDNIGWDGWMASLTRWTWVWASSSFWWWTGKPGVLQSMGWQRVRHNGATELNWNDI